MNWPEATLRMFRETIVLGCWIAGAYIAYRVSIMVKDLLDGWFRFAFIRDQAEVERMRKANLDQLERCERVEQEVRK